MSHVAHFYQTTLLVQRMKRLFHSMMTDESSVMSDPDYDDNEGYDYDDSKDDYDNEDVVDSEDIYDKDDNEDDDGNKDDDDNEDNTGSAPPPKRYRMTLSIAKNKKLPELTKVEDLTAHFQTEAQNAFCTAAHNRRKVLKCSCLMILQNDEAAEAVARGSLKFLQLPISQRQEQVTTYLRYCKVVVPQESKNRVFFFPMDNTGLLSSEMALKLSKHQVCKSALMLVTFTGPQFWKTCHKALESSVAPVHGLKGKSSNRAQKFGAGVASDLREFVEDIEQQAEPRATRLV